MSAGSNPADRIGFKPYRIIHMVKKKATKKKKPGRKPETLKIEGDWKDAVAHALMRGRPPQDEKDKRRSD